MIIGMFFTNFLLFMPIQRTIQGTFLLSLVPIGPVVSEKKLEM
jgi:hypothetical protein